MGAGFGGVVKIFQTVLPKEQRNKITENQQNIQRASELIQDPNITPEKKEALDNLAAKSSAENTKLEKEGIDKLNSIPEENRMEFSQLSEKASNIEDQIDTEQDPLVKKALESELTDTQTKIKEIENAVQKQTTSEVPVQPETISGQEVPQGQPQAEPQVTPQEGQVQEEVVDVSNKEQLTKLKERVSDVVKTKIIEQAEKGINTLKSVLPNFNIEVYENTAAYNTAINEIGGEVNSAGTFSYQQNEDGTFSGKILVNLDTANERTISHEITHGILLGKFGDTPEVFSNFHNQIKGVVSESDNVRLNDFVNQYDESSKPEEYLAELSSIMTTEGKTLSPDIITKIAKIVNQIVSTLTGGTFTPFAETANKSDVIDFFNQISTAMQKGEMIGETALNDKMMEQGKPQVTSQESQDVKNQAQKINFDKNTGDIYVNDKKVEIPTALTNSPNSIPNALDFASASNIPTNIEFKRALQERFQNYLPELKKKYGENFDPKKENDVLKSYLVDAYTYETMIAMKSFPDALGWYDAKTKAAMETMSLVHPEIATDPVAAGIFKIAVAVTSNGNKVTDNFIEADRQYNYFKDNGKFDEVKSIGTQSSGIKATFKLANEILNKLTKEQFINFLTSKFRAGDLKYTGKDGKSKALLPGFTVDTEVFGASIFGPKIGNGFFMNLYGDFSQLTMDRWFMRQYGRLTGTLINVDPAKVKLGVDRLKSSLKTLGAKEKKILNDLIPNYATLTLDKLAEKIVKVSSKVDKREILQANTKLDELRKAGNSLDKNSKGEIEAPKGGNQRSFIIDVFDEVQKRLKNEFNLDITIADLQAVNWYPEKALYQTFQEGKTEELGAEETSENEQPDYESAAKKLARNYGFTEKQINDKLNNEDGTRKFNTGGNQEFGRNHSDIGVELAKKQILEVKASLDKNRGQTKSQKVASKGISTAEDFAKANEEFGTEDGQIGFKTKSQLNPKEVSTVSEQISNSASEQQLEELKKLINNDVKVPTETKTVYKLFKVKKGYPGELFPLFVGANQSVTTGEWIQAKAGELTQTKEGKTMVKSTLGPLAYRPGWHSGDIPIATHIGSKVNKNDRAPSFRAENQVWAEVEVGNDVDWQTIANERAEIGKNGKAIAKTAHITDQVPLGGSYKYKTNSNMTGSWVISGEMKVNKVLTQSEVDQLNKAENAKDLPRRESFNFETYGFNNDGSVQNPKQVVSNQVARAYLDAKETGNNPELVSAVDSALESPTQTKAQKYTLEKGPLRPSYGAPAPNVKVYEGGNIVPNPRTGEIYWYYGEANKFVNEKNGQVRTKSQLVPTNIKTEYDADIAAGKTATEAMKNLLAQGYSYNQIGNEIGRGNIQESYNAAIAEMGKEVADRYSDAQEVRLKEIEDYLGSNPVSVEQLRADLIELGYADLEIFTAMNRNLFSQQELFDAFGKTYRQTVQNAILESRYPAQDLNEISDDARNFKVLQSVSDLTDNFADFTFVDANILVEHMVKTIKQSGLIEASNALAKHLEKKTVDQIPLAITNFGEIASIAGRILVMARFAKKDMSDLVIGSIERGPIRISEESKAKIKKLVQEYNLKKDVYDEAKQTFGTEKDDASFTQMLNAEAEFYVAGDNLMDVLEKFKLRYWNDVLTSFSTRALLSIATTPLSLWGNIEQGLLGQVSSPVRAAISKVKGASKKTNRLSFADYYLNQSLSIKKGLSETWDIISQGKYRTPDMAEKYMDGIADVNAQTDIKDSIRFIAEMIGSQAFGMMGSPYTYLESFEKTQKTLTDEEFAAAYDKLMYQTQNGDIKLTNGKAYTVSSAIFRSIIGTIPEITGRMLAISGDRIAFHAYKTRTLVDYIRMVEAEVKAGKRDTELQRYIAKELKGKVKNSDMDLLINLSTVLSDNSDFGKEEALKRVFMNDNFATSTMTWARSGLKKGINKTYLGYLGAKTPQSKVFNLLAKNTLQGLDVITWTVSPFTRVPVNVLAAGMQNTIPLVSPFMALASYMKFASQKSIFNEKYGDNKIAQLKTESQQKQYEKDRQELFEKRRQYTYAQSAVVTSAAIGAIIIEMAISGALTPPAGADDEDRRKALNASAYRPSEFNITYYKEYLAADSTKREKLMITRGWKPGDKVIGYQNFGLIGQAMGYYSSNAYQFGKEKVKKRSYIANQQPTISGVSAFFSLGESSIQNISALQTIGLAIDISKAPDEQKAFEKLLGNMLAATGAVAAPNALSFFAKGKAQTQMSLGQVIPAEEVGGVAYLGRVGIQAATKLSKNSQVFGAKTDYFGSGIGVFGEELKLNLTGEEPGTAAAYLSAMINPFGLRSFAQVKGGDVKAELANNLYNTVTSMSMVSDELGLVDDKGKPLNMWSALSVGKNNTYEIGSGVSKVTLSLPFDMYRKELQILGELRYNGLKIHINNYSNNLEQLRMSEDNLPNIEKLTRDTFSNITETMKNTLDTYESEFTSLRLRGILNEMDRRGLITQEDKNKIELALPGQFIK
jgi:Mn-dependent DtxR family transcriptional regulator